MLRIPGLEKSLKSDLSCTAVNFLLLLPAWSHIIVYTHFNFSNFVNGLNFPFFFPFHFPSYGINFRKRSKKFLKSSFLPEVVLKPESNILSQDGSSVRAGGLLFKSMSPFPLLPPRSKNLLCKYCMFF